MSQPDLRDLAAEIADLVARKRESYGDSFPGKIAAHLRLLYPNGVQLSQFSSFLLAARLIDKLHRLVAAPTAFDEDPIADLVGYGLLMLAAARERKERQS